MDDRKMTLSEAVEFVNTDLAYKPGWILQAGAEDHSLYLTAIFTAPNSNRELARMGYPSTETVTPIPTLRLNWPEEGAPYSAVLDTILMWLVDIEIHEAREFLRVRSDDYAAPFHPHHWSGYARFEMMDADWPTNFPRPDGDLDIGLHEDAQTSTHAREMLDDFHAFRDAEARGGPDLASLPPELAALLGGAIRYGETGGDPLAGLIFPEPW